MEKLNKPAILVVDMLNDFVTGAIGCDRARAIVPATARLLDAAREKGVPVIFCNDAHRPGIDREVDAVGELHLAAVRRRERRRRLTAAAASDDEHPTHGA